MTGEGRHGRNAILVMPDLGRHPWTPRYEASRGRVHGFAASAGM